MASRRKNAVDQVQDPLFHPDPRLFETPSELLFGLTLRSPVSHGKLLAMIYPPLPEGFTLLRAEDLPGSDVLHVLKSRLPLLNGEMVRYIGEPIALVAGPQEAQVRAWAKKVRFTFQKLPLEQFSQGVRLKSRSLAGGHYIPDDQPVKLIEGVYSTGAQDAGVFDACEALAVVQNDEAWLSVKSQWPGNVVHSVARALGLEASKVRVKAQPSSAHLNSQVWFPTILAVHAALLSQASGHPVRMTLSKDEEFFYSPKRPESRILLRSTVDLQGRILDFSADAVLNMGAYGVLEEELLDRCILGLLTPYRFGAFQVNAHSELSHTPPRGPVGGMGENLGIFALESHIQDLCEALELDPMVWRQANALSRDQIAFTGEPWKGEAPLTSLISELGKAADFPRKYASFHQLNSRTKEWRDEALPLRGIGLAAGFQGNGFLAGGTSTVNLEIRLEADSSLSVYSPLVTANDHLLALWKHALGDPLGIAPELVRFCPVITGEHPTGGPSLASRAFEIMPKLLAKAGHTLAQRRAHQPLPLNLHTLFRRKANPAWDPENFTGQPFLSLSWVGAVAEVEVLPLLSEIRIKKITLMADAGPLLDETAARDALTEGILSAVGWVFSENIFWEKLSIPRSIFQKYRLPSVREVPRLEILFYQNPKGSPPRGLGSLGSSAVAPALLSAIRQALAPSWRHLPVTRKMLDEALRKHEAELDPER